jgi:hypothetical protein
MSRLSSIGDGAAADGEDGELACLEEIVEIMRRAARELSRRLHLFSLNKGRFRLLALRYLVFRL